MLRGAKWPVVSERQPARRAGQRAPPGRLFVSRLTGDRLFDVRRDEMRLVRFVDLHVRTQTTRHNAARKTFAEIVRLFLIVRLMAHGCSPRNTLDSAEANARRCM